jgi:hypothetical protein
LWGAAIWVRIFSVTEGGSGKYPAFSALAKRVMAFSFSVFRGIGKDVG